MDATAAADITEDIAKSNIHANMAISLIARGNKFNRAGKTFPTRRAAHASRAYLCIQLPPADYRRRFIKRSQLNFSHIRHPFLF